MVGEDTLLTAPCVAAPESLTSIGRAGSRLRLGMIEVHGSPVEEGNTLLPFLPKERYYSERPRTDKGIALAHALRNAKELATFAGYTTVYGWPRFWQDNRTVYAFTPRPGMSPMHVEEPDNPKVMSGARAVGSRSYPFGKGIIGSAMDCHERAAV